MYKYRIYGLIFETDIPFPECESVSDEYAADVTVRYNALQEMVDELNAYLTKKAAEPGAKLPTSFTRKGKDVYCSYIVDILYVRITGNNLVEYRAVKDTDDMVFRQWMLCYAMTLALIKKHEIILHCAGLLIPGTDDAVLVCGDSGAGKSTTSNALLDRGLLFVSDDSVRVAAEDGQPKVFGSCMQRRLCMDIVENEAYDKSMLSFFKEGEREKWVVNMGDQYYGGVPHRLKNIFFLTLKEKGDVTFTEITGAAKVTHIMRALYKTGAYKDEGLTSELFIKIANIAKDINFFIVERPAEGMTVDAITDRICKICFEGKN